jgi:hypothetical protein
VTSRSDRVVLLVFFTVVAAALWLRWGGDNEPIGPGTPDENVIPLLGTEGEPAPQAALVVKIDNTGSGRPQAGIRQADLVVEEVVEGGLTRLLVVFHSQDPETVGPVRSARSTDLSVMAELGRPLFAWSGANPTFRAQVESAGLIDVGVSAEPQAYRREATRPAPYNLFADPVALRTAGGDEARGDGTAPQRLFEYRDPSDEVETEDARATTGMRSVRTTQLTTAIGWSWNPDTRLFERTQGGTPHVDNAGERVAVPNVVLRMTPYVDSGVRDSAGAVVPEAETVGAGDAWLLSGGRAQPGRWEKTSDEAVTTFTGTDGEPLRLLPGRTWIEMLPPGAAEIL